MRGSSASWAIPGRGLLRRNRKGSPSHGCAHGDIKRSTSEGARERIPESPILLLDQKPRAIGTNYYRRGSYGNSIRAEKLGRAAWSTHCRRAIACHFTR